MSLGPLSFWYLMKSFYFLQRGKASNARQALDKSLARTIDKLDFIDAYDARISMQEDRHVEAREKFTQVSEGVGTATDDDERYIKLYCQLAFALYAAIPEARDIKAQAEALDPRRTLLRFLPLPSDDAISRILSSGNLPN